LIQQDFWNLVRTHLDESKENLVTSVLDDIMFWEGAGGSTNHHNYRGGLAEHTYEVAINALSMTDEASEKSDLLVAAIFHDYGKIYDYSINPVGVISDAPFKKEIGHLVWGYRFFANTAERMGFPQEWVDRISHVLLAHHGRREWGAAVEPRSKLAFILHSADMLSVQNFKKRK